MTSEAKILGYKRTCDNEWVEVWSNGVEIPFTGTLLGVKLEVDYQLDLIKGEVKNALLKWLRGGY